MKVDTANVEVLTTVQGRSMLFPIQTVWSRSVCLLAGLILVSSSTPAAAQFGPVMSATGPINQSMGGTSTGAPLSASGALMWNPATLSGLERSELDVGAELVFPHASVASQVGPFSGSTDSEDSVFPLPMIALAYRPQNSPFTYGLGAFAVAGFGLNYPGSAVPTGNPILFPQPLGTGPIYSQYSVMQIAPAVVFDVTDELSVSFSPLLDIGSAQIDPALFATPTPLYPTGTHSSQTWGAGFSLGAYYETDVWGWGASYKSQQWFQPYHFNTLTGALLPQVVDLNLDLPAIVSVGTSYRGIDGVLLAADLRYLDYNSTAGFGDSGFTAGALNGVGLQSIFAASLGAQLQVTDAMTVRMGYSWSENPVTSAQVTANVASPLVIQNMLSAGATYEVTKDFSLSLAYTHAFENSVSGPIVTAGGPVPFSRMTSTASIDMLTVGATVKFGGPR